MILVPIESVYVIVILVLSCTFSEILQVFVLMSPPYSTLILGSDPVGPSPILGSVTQCT